MPLSEPGPREAIHCRDVICRGFRRADGLWDIEAHLTDTKTYDFDNRWRGKVTAGQPVHEMWLRITVDDNLAVIAAEAATDNSPYPSCANVTGDLAKLKGLRIAPGWTNKVRALFGGVKGCTHLTELLGPLATTAYQTVYPARHRFSENPTNNEPRPPVNTCHALAAGGEVITKYWPELRPEPHPESHNDAKGD